MRGKGEQSTARRSGLCVGGVSPLHMVNITNNKIHVLSMDIQHPKVIARADCKIIFRLPVFQFTSSGIEIVSAANSLDKV